MPNQKSTGKELKGRTKFSIFEAIVLVLISLFSLFSYPEPKKESLEEIESRNAGYELREASAKGIMWFGISLIVGAVVMHVGLGTIFFQLRRYYESHPPEASQLKTSLNLLQNRVLPPEPRLQKDPQKDLQIYIQKEKQLLSNFSWIDSSSNKVRIPIDLAMELIIKKTNEKLSEKQRLEMHGGLKNVQ